MALTVKVQGQAVFLKVSQPNRSKVFAVFVITGQQIDPSPPSQNNIMLRNVSFDVGAFTYTYKPVLNLLNWIDKSQGSNFEYHLPVLYAFDSVSSLAHCDDRKELILGPGSVDMADLAFTIGIGNSGPINVNPPENAPVIVIDPCL